MNLKNNNHLITHNFNCGDKNEIHFLNRFTCGAFSANSFCSNVVNLKLFQFILFVLFIFINFSCQLKEIENEHVHWLKDNALEIKSIDPDNEDFSDLQPLKKMITDSIEIVFLGEQTHGDGSTFLAKSRLIKFLHKEMGFDVLAFESGLYECTKAWQLMTDTNRALKEDNEAYKRISTSVLNLWSSTEQCRSLIKYIDECKFSKHPLQLSGFDCQVTGQIFNQYFLEDFDSLHLNCLTEDEYTDFKDLMDVFYYAHSYRPIKKDTSVYNKIFDKLLLYLQSNEKQSIASNKSILKNYSFWEHVIENLKIGLRLRERDYKKVKIGDPEINIRDIQMGKNIIWLSNHVFPGRKIIVWAHNYHNLRNPGNLTPVDTNISMYKYATTMGDIVFDEFRGFIYDIGFTAYEGEYKSIINGENIKIPESRRWSMEYLLYRTGFDYAFVNFRGHTESGFWLKQRILMKPIGYVEQEAEWPHVMDGVFYIKEMKPSSY